MGTELTTISDDRFAVLKVDQAELQEVLSDNLGGEGLSAFDLDRVKVPAGGATTWQVPTLEGEASEREIEGIIIAWSNRRAYWQDQYSGGNEQPECSSSDGQTGVGDPGGSCAECEFAAWGSADDGAGQACKLMRQLFVLTADSLIPIVVTLPPSSLKPAKQYFIRLVRANLHYTGLVTKIGLEKAKSKGGIDYSRVTLTAGDRLDPAQAVKVKGIADQLGPALREVTVSAADLASSGDSHPQDRGGE